ILLILNLPLIPYIAKILKIPKPMLISLVTMFCLVGVYSLSFNTFDLYLLLIFGVIGYLMKVLNFPPAPFIISFILGGMMEQSLPLLILISLSSLRKRNRITNTTKDDTLEVYVTDEKNSIF